MEENIYCIDTSSLVTAWRFTYPYDNFKSLWEKIAGIAKKGRLITPMEVFEEIKKKDDELFKWINQYEMMFHELNEDSQIFISDILSKFDRLINIDSPAVQADPQVIALAGEKGAIVVTEEKPDNATKKKTKIPTVCNHYNIQWMSLIQVIKKEKWNF